MNNYINITTNPIRLNLLKKLPKQSSVIVFEQIIPQLNKTMIVTIDWGNIDRYRKSKTLRPLREMGLLTRIKKDKYLVSKDYFKP